MKQIKVGIFGGGRGTDVAKDFINAGADIVALCDNSPERLQRGLKTIGKEVATYENFDDFIQHDMDAVVIANSFHQHVPYVLKCFERNIHVFCECMSNGTMAEGVELVRAFEKSKSIYMLAENYPQRLFNLEIQKICQSGTLGKILYAEGEYNHPVDPKDTSFLKRYNYCPEHWRNYAPASYYLTHSLGPLMAATGATPKRVTAFYCYAPMDKETPTACNTADKAAIMMTYNDDGSVYRFTGCSQFAGHENSTRICGMNGQVENVRGLNGKLMLRYNPWSVPEGEEITQFYDPKLEDPDEEFMKGSGHGGADYLTVRYFLQCLREGKQPKHPFNVYAATVMSSVAILAHRSALEGGTAYELPDFRKEEDRKKYENDWLTPFCGEDGSKPTLPCCSNPDFAPTEEQFAKYLELIK